VDLFDNSLLVWVVIAAVGLFVLRFILKVTKKVLTLGILICLAVAASTQTTDPGGQPGQNPKAIIFHHQGKFFHCGA